MEIKRSGSQPSGKGPAEWFTGAVRIDSPFQRSDPARIGGAIVTFEPALAFSPDPGDWESTNPILDGSAVSSSFRSTRKPAAVRAASA